MPAVILNLPADHIAAIQEWGTKHGYTTTAQVLEVWVAVPLEQAIKEWHHGRWERRRKVLENNPGLAAQVDAAGP